MRKRFSMCFSKSTLCYNLDNAKGKWILLLTVRSAGRVREGRSPTPSWVFPPASSFSSRNSQMCWVHRAQSTVFGASYCAAAGHERTALGRHSRQARRWSQCWPQHSNP